MKQIKENVGLYLFLTNIFLFIIFILVQDPFSIFSKSYEKSPHLVPFSLNELKKIEIEIPEKDSKYIIDRVQFDSNKKISTVSDFVSHSSWSFSIHKNNTVKQYFADKENLKTLLETILDLRKYYSLSATNDNFALAGINEKNIKLKIINDNNKEIILQIGFASTRNNSTYVLLPSEQKIYQVEANLKNFLGVEDIYYFRNHRLISDIEKDFIKQLVLTKGNRRTKYAKAGGDWQALEPTIGKVETFQLDPLLNDIVNLKINIFYEDSKIDTIIKDYQKYNLELEIHSSKEMGETKIAKIFFYGKKDYGKYLVKYEDKFYEVSFFRLEDLLEPEKLLKKE